MVHDENTQEIVELFSKRNVKENNGIKYLTQSDNMPWRGGGLLGYITTDFNTLVELLGDDFQAGADGKTQANWDIYFEDGEYATVYDWKEYRELDEVDEWHIGGTNPDVVARVKKLIGTTTASLLN